MNRSTATTTTATSFSVTARVEECMNMTVRSVEPKDTMTYHRWVIGAVECRCVIDCDCWCDTDYDDDGSDDNDSYDDSDDCDGDDSYDDDDDDDYELLLLIPLSHKQFLYQIGCHHDQLVLIHSTTINILLHDFYNVWW